MKDDLRKVAILVLLVFSIILDAIELLSNKETRKIGLQLVFNIITWMCVAYLCISFLLFSAPIVVNFGFEVASDITGIHFLIE